MTKWFLGAVGSQMFGTGGLDIGGLNGDDGTVGVGNEAGGGVREASGVGNGGDGGNGETLGGEVFGLGGEDLGGLSGGDGTVGVGDEATVGVSVVSVVVAGVVSVVESVVVSVVEAGGVSVSALGGKVSGLGGGDLGGLSGGNSTVGVGDELSRGSSHASEKNLKVLEGGGQTWGSIDMKRWSHMSHKRMQSLPRTSCLKL